MVRKVKEHTKRKRKRKTTELPSEDDMKLPQDRQSTYNVIMAIVRATIVGVEKQ
jgi:hypothetical protein